MYLIHGVIVTTVPLILSQTKLQHFSKPEIKYSWHTRKLREVTRTVEGIPLGCLLSIPESRRQ